MWYMRYSIDWDNGNAHEPKRRLAARQCDPLAHLSDALDHAVDEAIRNVPLPHGLAARISAGIFPTAPDSLPHEAPHVRTVGRRQQR